jgi:hypothetical protein
MCGKKKEKTARLSPGMLEIHADEAVLKWIPELPAAGDSGSGKFRGQERERKKREPRKLKFDKRKEGVREQFAVG